MNSYTKKQNIDYIKLGLERKLNRNENVYRYGVNLNKLITKTYLSKMERGELQDILMENNLFNIEELRNKYLKREDLLKQRRELDKQLIILEEELRLEKLKQLEQINAK
jgi:hypothetical protein